MKMNKKFLVIASILIIILIGIIIIPQMKPREKAEVKPMPFLKEVPKIENALPKPAVDVKRIKSREERMKLPWGRDIFSTDLEKEYQISELQLKGISLGKDKTSFAFINDEIVKVGDRIGDYQVIEIEQKRVLIRKGNQSFYLTFPTQE